MSQEEWRRAQEFELAFWRGQHPNRPRTWMSRLKQTAKAILGRNDAALGDDWNSWWESKFDGYAALPQHLENAVELGCGPFTNIRRIARNRRIDHLWCSDPLVRHYLGFENRWLAQAWRRGEVLVDDHPLEECPFASDYFDLVVLINVLDHVRDGLLCVRQAARVARPGGYLIVGQDLTKAEDMERIGDDIGHPIRIGHEALDGELLPAFEPVVHRVLPRSEGRNPPAHYGTYLLIGRKRARSCRCEGTSGETAIG